MKEIALLAQIVEEVDKQRQRRACHTIGQHIGKRNALHTLLKRGDICHDLVFEHRKEVFFVAEMVVERPPIQIRTIAEIVHGYRIEAPLLKKSDERLAQSTLRTRDAAVFTS